MVPVPSRSYWEHAGGQFIAFHRASRAQSLALASVYHSAYDELCGALEASVGFGPLASL